MFDQPRTRSGPTALILGAILGSAFAAAFLSTGTGRHLPADEQSVELSGADREHDGIAAARSYEELGETPWFRRGDSAAAAARLGSTQGRVFVGTAADVIAARSLRRAFDGAPPVVPHGVADHRASSCLTCHAEGMAFPGGDRAPPICHDVLASCGQCHVSGASSVPGVDVAAAERRFGGSDFVPLRAVRGVRATSGAPPMIPHATRMRERCLSCHGATGDSPIVTQHPARAQCRQCHGGSASLDQHAFGRGDR